MPTPAVLVTLILLSFGSTIGAALVVFFKFRSRKTKPKDETPPKTESEQEKTNHPD